MVEKKEVEKDNDLIIEWTGKGIKVIPCIGHGIKTTSIITLHPGCNSVNKDDWAVGRRNCLNQINTGDKRGEIIDTINATIETVTVEKEVDVIDERTDKPVVDPKTDKVLKEMKPVVETRITVKDFKKLKPGEAEAIVKKTFAMDTLEKLLKKENRPDVRAEIKNQIDLVNNFHEKEKRKLKKEQDSR